MNKNVIIAIIAILVLAGLGAFFYFFYLYEREAPPQASEPALESYAPPSVLEEKPDLNPVNKTNPFKEIKTNPFE